jgi:ABC-2 type transport system ATP-binding protein
VSLQVQRGTVLGLLGPNGAGKTTAVRVLATLLRADGGRAAVDGHDVAAAPDAVRGVIGLAGQYAGVDANLTGEENLRLVARLLELDRRAARARAAQLLERFDLTQAARRPVRTYSGGMRRRLDLAAALVGEPRVLFLDEPTTGLDPRSRLTLWGVVEDLVADGTTVLLTTQYLEEADRLASRIAVIDHGRVITEGTGAELKARHAPARLVVDLPAGLPEASAAPALQALRELPGAVSPPAVSASPHGGARVELRVSGDGDRALAAAAARLVRAGVEPVGLRTEAPSLDDVFLSVTGQPADLDRSAA